VEIFVKPLYASVVSRGANVVARFVIEGTATTVSPNWKGEI